MAHSTGLLASATMLLTYLVLADRETFSPKSGLLFGPAMGICFATRWTGLLMGIVPITYFADHLAKAVRRRSWHEVKRIALQVPVLLGTFYLTISPQLVLLYRLHNRFIVVPQLPISFVDSALPVNLWKIIVHTNRGLVFWCPFVLVGCAGIVLIPSAKTRLMAAIAMISHLVLLGYRVDWFGGGGFGARYFIETLPFVAIGFVCILRKVPKRAGFQVLVALGAVALLVHQLVLLYAFEHETVGWPNPSRYITGKPLGARWQLDSLTELARDPSLWFTPRPHIGTDRQTMITNIRAGVYDPQAYRVTGTATALAPIVILIVVLLRRFASTAIVPMLPEGTMAYFVAWAVYLFQVG